MFVEQPRLHRFIDTLNKVSYFCLLYLVFVLELGQDFGAVKVRGVENCLHHGVGWFNKQKKYKIVNKW